MNFLETENFHDNLYGNNFAVYTDNKPLTYALSSAKLDATDHRCLASLGYFNFKIMYRSGKLNGDADGFSRRPQKEIVMSECCSCHASTMEIDSRPYLENKVINCNSHVASLQESVSPDDSSEFRKS